MPRVLLLLESSPDVKEVAKSLESNGYNVFMAVDSSLAIKLLGELDFEHIVIDPLSTVGLDGWKLVQIVRSGQLGASNQKTEIISVNGAYSHTGGLMDVAMQALQIQRSISFHEIKFIPSILTTAHSKSQNQDRESNILVVEDSEDLSRLITRFLPNHTVDIAKDGISAMRMYKPQHYSLVLLDLMLPEVSGVAVLERIKSLDHSQPVVVMTAHGSVDVALEVMKKGAIGYLMKPFDSRQLHEEINRAKLLQKVEC